MDADNTLELRVLCARVCVYACQTLPMAMYETIYLYFMNKKHIVI